MYSTVLAMDTTQLRTYTCKLCTYWCGNVNRTNIHCLQTWTFHWVLNEQKCGSRPPPMIHRTICWILQSALLAGPKIALHFPGLFIGWSGHPTLSHVQ